MRRAGALVLLVTACSGRVAEHGSPSSATGTPVTVIEVAGANLAVTVRGPGRTEVLRPLHIRAPFTGTLTALNVADGDRVGAGDQIGSVVARGSAAALLGARAMRDAAHTDAERRDAERAIALAQQNLVQQPLRAPEGGVVLSHGVNAGDLVNEGDDILIIAPAGSIAFIAQIPQGEVALVRPGQPARVDLAARPNPLPGVVHAILPAASLENLSVSVRIDFTGTPGQVGVGLFGTTTIRIALRRSVAAVPEAAVMRDDIYGTTRIAVVAADGRAHWLEVRTGARDEGLVEITEPALTPGTRVIVTGQVGLPEGTPVRWAP